MTPILLALLTLLTAGKTFAQQSITANQMNYLQNFDGLPASSGANNTLTWKNNNTLANWYAARTDYAGQNTIPMRATDGSYGGPHLCSFRLSSPTSNKALGSIGAGDVHFAWGIRFKNNSGAVLRSITLSYYLEQWRKSNSGNEQPIRFSYKVSSTPITALSADENGYAKVPFLNAVSPVNNTDTLSRLNGNLAQNRVLVSHKFAVTVQPGQEIMLKWYDEDDAKVDHGLSIDDLNIQFSTSTLAFDLYSGAMSLDHFMKSVILDIPDEDAPFSYIVPSSSQRNTWQTAMQQLVQGQYTAAAATLQTNGLGYRLTKFPIGSETYYVVSKDGLGANYWGTYVFNPAADRSCVSFQAPHPIHDVMTGEQATFLFRQLDAYALMVAGTHRCLNSTPSYCAGKSNVCRADSLYTISDMAHTVQSVYHVTTEVVANQFPSQRFIQLHGFEQSADDPHFIISNGTRQTPSTDFVFELGEQLEAAGSYTYEAPHLNTNYNFLIGTTNTQGRFLNNYNQGDICSGKNISTSVTGRFMHIEQFGDMRKIPSNYPFMADILANNSICNCNPPAGRSAAYTPQTSNQIQVRYNDSNELTCYLQTSSPGVHLSIYNLTGQMIAEQWVAVEGDALTPLPAGNLPKGIYVASAVFGSEQKTVKFIVR